MDYTNTTQLSPGFSRLTLLELKQAPPTASILSLSARGRYYRPTYEATVWREESHTTIKNTPKKKVRNAETTIYLCESCSSDSVVCTTTSEVP